MAYSNRDANYVLNVHARWEMAADNERCSRWAREFFTRSQPYASGCAFVNFLPGDETDLTAFAYGASYEQLMAFKKKFDPINFFLINTIRMRSRGSPSRLKPTLINSWGEKMRWKQTVLLLFGLRACEQKRCPFIRRKLRHGSLIEFKTCRNTLP
jgi:hypothetical protein